MYTVAQGEGIDDEAPADVANFLSVEIHPRPKGMLLKRLISISEDSAQVQGKSGAGQAFQLYRDVRAIAIQLLDQGTDPGKPAIPQEPTPHQIQPRSTSAQMILI